uniref:Uncharacterized protein n=1 Tax=Trichogramma kaykai TaxID=54128 RepID=A0ABD2XB12_9HYME
MFSFRKPSVIFGLTFTLIGFVNGFIAYNCNTTTSKLKAVSLLDFATCDMSSEYVQSDHSRIQLLRLDNFHETKVIQCKINVRRQIYTCDVGSHGSTMLSNEAFIHEVDYLTCNQIHSSKSYVHRGIDIPIIQQIEINSTVHKTFDKYGANDIMGNCVGHTYFDYFGMRDNVTVHIEIEISIYEQTAKIDTKNNKIHLKSGDSCDLNIDSCLDSQNGNSFWEAIPNYSCQSNQYSVLFQGDAQKLTDSDIDNAIIYTFNTRKATESISLCAPGRRLPILTLVHDRIAPAYLFMLHTMNSECAVHYFHTCFLYSFSKCFNA